MVFLIFDPFLVKMQSEINKYFSDCIFTMKGSNIKKNILRHFFLDLSILSSCKISGLTFDPFTFSLKNDIFLYNICRKIFFCKIFTVLHQYKKFHKKIDQKWVNASQLKKTCFGRLTLLTYSALPRVKITWLTAILINSQESLLTLATSILRRQNQEKDKSKQNGKW